MPDKITILGADYTYNETTDREDSRLCDKDGYCDVFGKSIAIETDHNDKHPDSVSNMDAFTKHVRRHEILHAYFGESGLSDYRNDETLVDWIAWQLPKIIETCKEVDAL